MEDPNSLGALAPYSDSVSSTRGSLTGRHETISPGNSPPVYAGRSPGLR